MKQGTKGMSRRYRYILMAPYAVAFVALIIVGYQLLKSSSPESLDQSGVGLTTSKPQYAIGENIKYTIVNSTKAPVYVANNCPGEPLQVYRMENGRWSRLHSSVDKSKCVNENRTYEIAAESQVSSTYRYWLNLFSIPGQYRLTAPIEGSEYSPTVIFTVIQ
jgi:hypothetical protein